MNEPTNFQKLAVWDIPTRLFHWSVVILVGISWYSSEHLFTWLDWHQWSGYILLILLIFRIIWGFVGSETARFRHFLYPPRTLAQYTMSMITLKPDHYLGHNPLGGISVILLLLLLFIQTITGLFMSEETVLFFSAPLRSFVDSDTADWMATIHEYNFNVLLGLVAIHILAVIFHLLVKRENLVRPMFTGYKQAPTSASAYHFANLGFALLWLALSSILVLGLIFFA